MASVTVTLPESDEFIDSDTSRVGWFYPDGSLTPRPSLGSELSEGGGEQWIQLFSFPLTLQQQVDIRISPAQTGEGVSPGPDFSSQMEMFGTITCELADSETVVITGISDATEPYYWTPSNLAEIYAFANHALGLADRTLTVTFDDNSNIEQLFTKVGGVWLPTTVYTKQSGAWVEAKVYNKQGGAWVQVNGPT